MHLFGPFDRHVPNFKFGAVSQNVKTQPIFDVFWPIPAHVSIIETAFLATKRKKKCV